MGRNPCLYLKLDSFFTLRVKSFQLIVLIFASTLLFWFTLSVSFPAAADSCIQFLKKSCDKPTDQHQTAHRHSYTHFPPTWDNKWKFAPIHACNHALIHSDTHSLTNIWPPWQISASKDEKCGYQRVGKYRGPTEQAIISVLTEQKPPSCHYSLLL